MSSFSVERFEGIAGNLDGTSDAALGSGMVINPEYSAAGGRAGDVFGASVLVDKAAG